MGIQASQRRTRRTRRFFIGRSSFVSKDLWRVWEDSDCYVAAADGHSCDSVEIACRRFLWIEVSVTSKPSDGLHSTSELCDTSQSPLRVSPRTRPSNTLPRLNFA